MHFYKQLDERLNQFLPDTHFATTDLLEYMVLESIGCLPALQELPLKTIFRYQHVSNIVFEDGIPRSNIQLGLKEGYSAAMKERLRQVALFIQDHNEDWHYDYEHPYYNYHDTLFAFVLPDENIERAIHSSSLYKAAGDLSQFDLYDLVQLRATIQQYDIADKAISELVATLTARITNYIESNFAAARIRKTEVDPKANRIVQLIPVYDTLHKISKHLDTLKLKAKPFIMNLQTPEDNPDYDATYGEVAKIAQDLQSTLNSAWVTCKNSTIPEALPMFRSTCEKAIHAAEAQLKDHDAWYALDPLLRGFLGVLAALFIVPALVIELSCANGYMGTFFAAPKSDAREELAEVAALGSAMDGMALG